MKEHTLETAIANFMDCLVKPWADSLSALLGTPCKVTVEDGALTDPGAKPLCLGITFEGLIVGDAALVIATVDRQTLTIKSSESPRDYAESALETQDPTIQQSLRQSLIAALNDFQTHHGPLVARIDPCDMPSWTPHKTLVLQASSDDRPAVHAYFLCNQNLRINDLAKSEQSREASNGKDNMGLVMNAALEVTLRFGQQSLTLAKLAALGPGSVIELDRKVEEPIDLVLGGRVLARGEVMIVDGNYGLRVTELLDRSQL